MSEDDDVCIEDHYLCCVCGSFGPWTESHRWHGSVRDLAEGNGEVLCSATCHEAMRP